ncbi:MAG: TIGR00366 family protein, partial [Myxococcota bacterium]
FGMQMCLILVTGHALASSPPVSRGLDRLTRLGSTPTRAVWVVALTAMGLALFNWGLGLIGGALMARRVGIQARRDGTAVHYPLLAAAGYCGLLVWHGGLSGSAPLKVTTERDLLQVMSPDAFAAIGAIGLERTVLRPTNLVANLTLLLLVPWALTRMMPPTAQRREAPPADPSPEAVAASDAPTFASRVDGARSLAFIALGMGVVTWVLLVAPQGLGRLNPDLVNFIFLFAGLALHGSPRAYGRAVGDAAAGCSGIILQFPFYAGIMGLLAGSGLLLSAAEGLATVGRDVLPVATFYAAGLINLFVPSGGGQWAVQGPVLMEAAFQGGMAPERLVLALAYGDQWTNMLQPFWALPLLAITKVEARDIVGYTAAVMLLAQFVFVAALYVGW